MISDDSSGDEEDEQVSASRESLRFKRKLLEALQADFLRHGVEVIAACRTENPLQYMKVIALLLPKGSQARRGKAPGDELARLSDQELYIRTRTIEAAIATSTSTAPAPSKSGADADGTQTPDRHTASTVLPPLR